MTLSNSNIMQVVAKVNNVLDSIVFPTMPCEDEIPLKTVDVKQTCNRGCIQFSHYSLLQKAQIDAYKQSAQRVPVGEQAKSFLNMIYGDDSYKRNMLKEGALEGAKPLRRGNQARNWMEDGRWKCSSLHYINSIYQTMGKKQWSDNGTHGKQGTAGVKQCGAFTKAGCTQCKRSCTKGSIYCTQNTHRYPLIIKGM